MKKLLPGSIILGAVCSLSPLIAHAVEEDEPVRLSYTAPPGCPSEAAFIAHVRRRTSRMRAPREGESARVFSVTIEGTAPSEGRLTILGAGGEEAVRKVEGDHCEEVVYAIAFAAALAVDPSVGGAPQEVAPPPPPRPPPPQPPRTLPKPRRRIRFALGIEVIASTLASPVGAFGGGAFAEATYMSVGPLSPSLRLGADVVIGPSVEVGRGRARFDRWTGALEACPTGASLAWLRATACLHVDAGVLHGVGSEVFSPKSATGVWLALGPSAVLRAALGRGTFVELKGVAAFPVNPPEFYFEPSQTAFSVPPIGAEGSLGFGVELN